MRVISCFLVLLGLVSCGKQEASINTSGQTFVVTGQVFVVTQGRDNIKMALVGVAAIPEMEMLQYITEKHHEGLQQQTPLRPAYEASVKDAEIALAALDKAKYRYEQAEKKLYAPSSKSDTEANAAKVVNEWLALQETVPRAKDNARPKVALMSRLKAQFDYFDSGPFYFQKLPTPIAVSKTDADGRFSLSLPKGKYVIAATTNRKVANNTENYYWLVSVDLTSSNRSLMLSNDNLFETGCKDCIQPSKVPGAPKS